MTIRMRKLTEKDYNDAASITAVVFLLLALANRVLLVPGLMVLLAVFPFVSLLFYGRAAYGSWNFVFITNMKEFDYASN